MKQDSFAIQVVGVSKVYGKGESAFLALNNVALNILDNEFFTLLGPSGCGKTLPLTMSHLIFLIMNFLRFWGHQAVEKQPCCA